jgi:HAD superfamily hydrolase (TIGR01509 family)
MLLHYESWRLVTERHGLSFTEEQFYAWAGTPVVEVVRRLASGAGVTVDAQAIAQERDDTFHTLAKDGLKPLVPVVEIARRYHGTLPMAVATGSTRASATESLRAIGVLELFEVIVSAEDVANPKPAPDIFLLAAQRIGVAAEHCVVFEDADAGLAAGRAAGMHAVDIRAFKSSGVSWLIDPQGRCP